MRIKRRPPYANVILDSWTLQDVCLFLNRDTLDTLSLTAHVFRRAVWRMPAGTCLRALGTLELQRYKPKWSWRSMEVGLFSACFVHFLDNLKRLNGPYRVLSRLEEYMYTPKWSPVYVERHKRFWRVERAVEHIRAELRHSYVGLLDMRLPGLSALVGASLANAEPRGVVDVLRISANALDVPHSAFENLPLLFNSIRRLHLDDCFGLTAGHQTDRFIRNCIISGVQQLRMNYYGDTWDRLPDSELSDISEESLLEFCFGPHQTPDEWSQWPFNDLQLNWINLSTDFLPRFVQIKMPLPGRSTPLHGPVNYRNVSFPASEACEDDRKLMVILRGGKLFPQDFSLFEIRQEFSTAYREFCGRSRLVVGRNVDTNFLFICRTSASWRWHDGGIFLPHHADFGRSDADHWIYVSSH